MLEPKIAHAHIWPKEQHQYTVEIHEVNASITNLSSMLVNLPHYTKLTKEEIINLMDSYLNNHDREVHLQLFDSFLEHHLIIPETDSVFFSIHSNHNAKANGVFTPLTKCYSTSCQTDGLSCYSPLCPNKKNQMEPLRCVNSFEYNENSIKREQDLIKAHPKVVYTKKELKRQAAIAELLSTEYNYCQDLKILDQIYAIPLLESEEVINNKSRRQRFYHTVFGNYLEIKQLHNSFYSKTAMHWKSGIFCDMIGKYILQHVTGLVKPYLSYAAHHAKSAHCLTLEQRCNKRLNHFLEAQDKKECTRRLGIYHYLTSPTLWIGKLKLLVGAILKNTEPETANEEDRTALKSSVAILHSILLQMNELPVTTEKELRQEELLGCIYVQSKKSMEFDLLKVPDNSRLIEEDTVKLVRANHPLQFTASHLFLFSHALVVAQQRIVSDRTEYVVLSGFPISTQMLFIDHALPTPYMRRSSLANSYQLTSSIRNPEIYDSDEINKTAVLESIPDIPERSTSSMIKQIKTKLLKLRTNKHQPSLSAPVSPVSSDFPSPSFSRPSRRGSEPLLLKNSKQKSLSNDDKIVKVGHRTQPEFLFQLSFDSRIKREGWKAILTNKIQHYADKNLVEMQPVLGQSLIELSIPFCASHSTPASSLSSLSFETTNSSSSSKSIGEKLNVTCACSFTYHDKNYLLLATKDGILIGPDTECDLFISLPSIRQMSMLDSDTLVVLIGHQLVQYSIDGLLKNTTENSHPQGSPISSNASCFTIGKIKNQAVILYITLEQILILKTPERMEYNISTKDPISIQCMDPLIIIRSLSNDTECIDITDQLDDSSKLLMGPLIGCAPLDRHHGILSNSYCGWFYSNSGPDKTRQTISYESHVNHIATCYPYLLCFSNNVIEIRHVDTGNLLQVIQGHHIRYLTHNSSHFYFTMSTQLFKIQISTNSN